MTQLVDKGLLLACGLTLTLITSFHVTPVVFFLCALIVMTLDELWGEKMPMIPIFCVAAVLSLFFFELMFFLPALAYCITVRKRTPVIFLFFLPYALIIGVGSFTGWHVLLLLFFLLSLLLSDRQRNTVNLTERLHQIRDDDWERQLRLQRQAAELEENQTNRIRIATLKERTRIAREIHDNVGHLLSRSLLQVGALQTVYKDDPSLQALRESLDLAMNGIRSSVHNLRDEALDLENSAKLLLDSYTDYRTSLTIELNGTVSPPITYCFLTIMKEALTNIQKHSNADSIRVSVKEYPSLYQLLIADNGTNAKVPEYDSGMGLQNMKERVEALSGVLRFSVADGFHIFVSIPK